jgi:hypothetical protein
LSRRWWTPLTPGRIALAIFLAPDEHFASGLRAALDCLHTCGDHPDVLFSDPAIGGLHPTALERYVVSWRMVVIDRAQRMGLTSAPARPRSLS